MDEVQILNVKERMEQLVALDERRGAIVKSLEERKLMTDILRIEESTNGDAECAGGHLRAVPSETPHAGHHRQGKGPGTAGGLH
jgi:hypothetical protein